MVSALVLSVDSFVLSVDCPLDSVLSMVVVLMVSDEWCGPRGPVSGRVGAVVQAKWAKRQQPEQPVSGVDPPHLIRYTEPIYGYTSALWR